jgi:hypothetical protein
MSVKILGIKALRQWRYIKPGLHTRVVDLDLRTDRNNRLRSKILRDRLAICLAVASAKPVKFMMWWIYLTIGLPLTLIPLSTLNDHTHRHARASSYQIETNGKTYRLMERNYFYYWFDNLGTFASLDEAKHYRDVMIQTAQANLAVSSEKWTTVKDQNDHR